MKKILITGYNGFLGSNLIQYMMSREDYIFYYYQGDVLEYNNEYIDIDMIIHFASPSDSLEFADREKTARTIVEGTINMVKLAKKINAKLIYASSEASINPQNDYGVFKLAMERYIESNMSNYQILVIPRVYGTEREKGLIKKLKEKTFIGSKDQILEYIDINDFLEQTYDSINTDKKYIIYNNKIKKSIKEIEVQYVR